jgi:two-component system sensor histidine kinase PilS (NtrC family)
LQLKGGLGRNAELSTPVLHVIDEGPGVSAEAEEHLFEPFYTTNPDGTGLGLYISKELCEANQAQLSYRRTSKGKSCFTIHFSHADRNMD